MGGNYSVSATAATTVVSQSIVNVEQFCAATASNTVDIVIKTPPDCQGPNDAGTDMISVDITQDATATQTCSNQSTFSALMNATIKNDLSAAMAQSMAGVTWLGASLPSSIYETSNVTTNALNTVIQTTDYSDLQQCRSKASNIISVYINDCKLNRDIGDGKTSYIQKATADLTACVQNSNAMSSLAANIQNTETSSDTTTDPWVQMVATLGNVIMTAAIATALTAILIALISAFVAMFKYHSDNVASYETTKQMKIVEQAAADKRRYIPQPSAPPPETTPPSYEK